MRVLVCGGRDFNDSNLLYGTLSDIHRRTPITMIIEGGASGADTLAHCWGKDFSQVKTFKADWAKYGRSAGPIRNKQMLEEGKPNCVVAFPGGRGTAHMVTIAKEAGVQVIEVAHHDKQ